MKITHRLAQAKDVFEIMRLFQKARVHVVEDSLMLDYRKIEVSIESSDAIWLLTELDGKVSALVSMLVERPQRMAKISRLLVDPEIPGAQEVLRSALRFALDFIKNKFGGIDLAYTTTLSMSIDMQEVTVEEGFKILGVFPNARGVDSTQLNGLTVYYFDNVEFEKRYSQFSIHPVIKPFFQLAQAQMKLPDLQISEPPAFLKEIKCDPLPALELIRAPQFVEERFKRMRERHSQISHFYPFYTPNAIITDPTQEIEIYVRISDTLRFAAIIGENLEKAANPVELYHAALQLIRKEKVSYVEIINDAADVFGTECILNSGFTPCAYMPAFKKQGDTRRDYIAFGKSYEYLCRPTLNLPKTYIDFFKQYYKLERRNYFGKLPLSQD